MRFSMGKAFEYENGFMLMAVVMNSSHTKFSFFIEDDV